MPEQLTQQHTTTQLSEYAPTVTMDIELGDRVKPGEVINFNYETYIATMRARGASNQDIETAHVDIIDPSYRPESRAGTYHLETDERSAITEVTFNQNEADMNRALGHEFQHHLQARRGAIDENTSSGSYETGLKETMRAKKNLAVLGLGAMGTAAAVIVGPEILALPGTTAIAYGLSKMGLSGLYSEHWAEKEAREAGEQTKHLKIIAIEPSDS